MLLFQFQAIAVADSREPLTNMIGWLFLCCYLLAQGFAGFGATLGAVRNARLMKL
jgi:hypothetical protein